VSSARTASLAPLNERRLLATLAAVQFTHIMDFMIMMPLGANLMRVFAIGPDQFSMLVASYGLAAAGSGLLGGFVLDRFERKRALLALYAGFAVATLGCALAPTYGWLLFARIAAGAFGGVASSVVNATVGDAIPAARRGRAMGTVMSAFPLASILGVPAGLALAGWFEWHAPFFLLAVLSAGVLFVARHTLPEVPSHVSAVHPLRQMAAIVSHPVHVRGFVLTALLVFAGGCVIPFMAPSLVANAGLRETQLPLVYFFGGACTFFTMPWFGRLSDRHDKLRVLAAVSVFAVPVVLVLTRLGPASPWLVVPVSSLFFVGMSGRFAPAMALVTNAVEARYRGGFMSVNSAIQQASTGLATLLAGLMVTRAPDGTLLGYPVVGYLSVACFGLTVAAAAWLRAAAPEASRPAAGETVAGAGL
jgi:predicted MFS family arabinose efflux permease